MSKQNTVLKSVLVYMYMIDSKLFKFTFNDYLNWISEHAKEGIDFYQGENKKEWRYINKFLNRINKLDKELK